MNLKNIDSEQLTQRLKSIVDGLSSAFKRVAPILKDIANLREEGAIIMEELQKRHVGDAPTEQAT